MNDTTQHHAYQRGVRMANRWKRVKSTILKWDNFCVSKARRHKLPGWFGHIPIVLSVGSFSLLFALSGLFIIASIVAGITILLCLSLLIGKGKNVPLTSSADKNQSASDYMFENAVMNNEYDGAPYKSPNES